MALMKAGWMLWLLAAPRVSTLAQRRIAAIVLQGVLNVGSNTLSSSATSDLFGFQPRKASQLRAADGVYWNIGQISGVFVGTLLRRVMSNSALMTLGGGLVALSMLITRSMWETLHKEDRKPFSLVHANPFANLFLLVTSGRGLTHLSLASLFSFASSSATQSLLYNFRFNAVGFSPASNASFNSALSVPGILSQRFFIGRYLATMGNLGAFRLSTLVGTAGYLLLSVSHLGASMMQKTVQQFLLFAIIFDAFGRAGNYALYGMFIKQGISCAEDVGKGELCSAFDGLSSLSGVVMPLFWSRAYSFFNARGMPGGAFIIAAALNLLSNLCVQLAPSASGLLPP
jgi:hypothetical protein